MTRTAPTTPLPAQILDLLTAHYGDPMPGAQEEQLRDAVTNLVGLAARQRAMRELVVHDERVWDRLKAAPMQRK